MSPVTSRVSEKRPKRRSRSGGDSGSDSGGDTETATAADLGVEAKVDACMTREMDQSAVQHSHDDNDAASSVESANAGSDSSTEEMSSEPAKTDVVARDESDAPQLDTEQPPAKRPKFQLPQHGEYPEFDTASLELAYKLLDRAMKKQLETLSSRCELQLQKVHQQQQQQNQQRAEGDGSSQATDAEQVDGNGANQHVDSANRAARLSASLESEQQLLKELPSNKQQLLDAMWEFHYSHRADEQALPMLLSRLLLTYPTAEQTLIRLFNGKHLQRAFHQIIRERNRYMKRHIKLAKSEKRARHALNVKKRKLEQINTQATAAGKAPVLKSISDLAEYNEQHRPKGKVELQAQHAFKVLRVGLVVDGMVEGINTEMGAIFVDIWYKRNQYRGMIHVSQLCDKFVSNQNIHTVLDTGDAVRCVIIALDQEKLRVSLSLKESAFKQHGVVEHPIIERLSKTARANDAPDGEERKGSSAFVESLRTTIKKSMPEDSVRKLMEISKGRQVDGKNRLGQRERRKLIEKVYGDKAKFLMDSKDGDRSELQATDKAAKRKWSRADKPPTSNSADSALRYADDQPSNDAAADSLHPSWAAKRQKSSIVAPQGKKVILS